MSFPYIVDIGFGSEKATADNIGRVSFGSSSGSKLPTTPEELNQLVDEGCAFTCPVNAQTLEVSISDLSEGVQASLPANLKGVVAENEDETVVSFHYTVSGEGGDTIITLQDVVGEPPTVVYLVLKQPVD